MKFIKRIKDYYGEQPVSLVIFGSHTRKELVEFGSRSLIVLELRAKT